MEKVVANSITFQESCRVLFEPISWGLLMDEQLRIDPNDVRDLIEWHEKIRANLPENINRILSQYRHISEVLIEERQRSRQKNRELVTQLLRAFGLIPSSEKSARRPSEEPIIQSKDMLLAILRSKKDRHDGLGAWHGSLKKRHKGQAKALGAKILRIEDMGLTDEELAEVRREGREHIKRAELGDGDDPMLALPREMIIYGAKLEVEEDYVDAKIDRSVLPAGSHVESVFTEDRARIDFGLDLRMQTISVEKAKISTSDGQQIISASTLEYGPPRMQVTWNFLCNMIILISQYGMPISRFANLVSSENKKFTSGEVSRYFQYVATRLLPIYIELIYELAHADVFQGDDTPSLVLEIRRGMKLEKPDERQWASYATKEKAAETLVRSQPTLALVSSEILGFEFERLGPQKGNKTGFNTTVLSGKSDQKNPHSLIVLYRSHLGGLNNLLNSVLTLRNSENRKIVIQSDLSRVNLVSDPEVLKKVDVEYAGCTSHARRDFKRYEHEDPDLCERIVNLFDMLFYFEKSLELYNRNQQSVEAVRSHDSKETWEEILEVAGIIASKWSRETKLGEAARYVLKNYNRLIYYIKDPRVDVSNNFSERMLRMENIIESQAFFRSTIEGRVALDIIRTIMQTAIVADVAPYEYLMHVLKSPPDDVAENSQRYTPLTFREFLLN
jgi:hypothetical protein